MANYSQTTFAQAKTILAARLDDYNKVFWTDAELGRYIVEALRTWNAAAWYWRERAGFSTTAGTVFYDLGTQLSPALMTRSLTDTDVVNDICDYLMEPAPTGLVWNGTDKFTVQDLLSAIEQARDDFLYKTTCVVQTATQTVVSPPPNGRVTLTEQNIADIRRVDWFAQDTSLYKQLWREDEWSFNATRRLWETDANEVENYSIVAVHPIQLQLAPIPANPGRLEMLVVLAGADLTNSGTALGIPNDYGWVIKWGALSILLNRDGQVRDPERTQYCMRRWMEGVAMAMKPASVIQAQINGVGVQVDAIENFDTCHPTWRNESTTPSELALSGMNMLAVAGAPDGAYSVVCDVVRNAVVPTLDADFIDLGKEYFDAVIGYAQHLATFKMGGMEHQITLPMLDEFYQAAMTHNAELRANSVFYNTIQSRAQREMSERPAKVTESVGNP